MYHTFQATKPAEVNATKGPRLASSKRISTSNACGECRRRKIRCDGKIPCGQCTWYKNPEHCVYSKPNQRIVPSRKLIDKLSASVEQYQAVVDRLFPDSSIEHLASLSREELLLELTNPASTELTSNNIEYAVSPDTTPRSDGSESLEALAQAPDQDPELDEAKRHTARVQRISDDVNGLSLSVDRQSSYVGASSITAALKVIFKVAPTARRLIALNQTETALPSRAGSPCPTHSSNPNLTHVPPAEVGHALIESYFNHIHVLMPMIDEQQFWHTWLYGERKDPPWLALLNMVFALGSIASSDANDEVHLTYFKTARQQIDLESLGSGNLLMLQALGLLSGYYLHYVNRPNLANNLMGATLRQATVLGLHREYSDKVLSDGSIASSGEVIPADIRRRTWWSLFTLDCWASTTTGRPSGQLRPGMTVKLPEAGFVRIAVGPDWTDVYQVYDTQGNVSLKVLPLASNVAFCKLATRIQDALAATPLLKFEDLANLDAELVRWHDELPPMLRPLPMQKKSNVTTFPYSGSFKLRDGQRASPPSADADQHFSTESYLSSNALQLGNVCPSILRTPRAIMHWRYQNLRLLLHRPYLLATSLRRTPYASLSIEEKIAVGRCRIIAAQTISDISKTCQEELIAGWNAVWLLYQAVMVPLVSLFAALSAPRYHESTTQTSSTLKFAQEAMDPKITVQLEEDMRNWRQQIETALQFFDRFTRWSVAAKRSKDVVARLYEASKQLSDFNATNPLPAQSMYHQQDLQTAEEGQYGPTTSIQARQGLDFSGNIQSFMPDMHTGLPAQSTWGLSPNGDAAMNNFWFDDMMWDFPAANTEMPEDSTGGFGGCEFDLFTNLGVQESDLQTWDSTEFDQGPEQN